MNVEELLDLMEETLEEGTSVPFAATKRVVDVERCSDHAINIAFALSGQEDPD